MKILKNKKNAIIFCCLIASAYSCSKKTENVEINSIKSDKIVKMEKFISIVWADSLSKVSFDPKSQMFTFGEISMHKDSVERVYDSANEYKKTFEK